MLALLGKVIWARLELDVFEQDSDWVEWSDGAWLFVSLTAKHPPLRRMEWVQDEASQASEGRHDCHERRA